MSGIDRWVMAVSEELGLSAVPSDTRTILDMTKDVAHNVDRPAAPVTAYLVGIAVGRGKPLPEALKCVKGLADSWEGHSEES
jgi:uncharacterized protein DUF6457